MDIYRYAVRSKDDGVYVNMDNNFLTITKYENVELVKTAENYYKSLNVEFICFEGYVDLNRKGTITTLYFSKEQNIEFIKSLLINIIAEEIILDKKKHRKRIENLKIKMNKVYDGEIINFKY